MVSKILKALAWSLALVNFWIFSRFTVDDPFITWRYGRNLVQHGVWNYNPTNFDPTQAYTNPIFALLSIIPAAFGINVVVFFKVFSVGLVAGLIWYFFRNRPSANLPLAIFFALPATMIHIFSGLETFLYVVLLFFLLLAVHYSKTKIALGITIALFLTRPEAWLLLALVPLALSTNNKTSAKRFDLWAFIRYFTVLALPLASYFLIHIMIFGQALPNTFFVKSGQYFIGPSLAFWLLSTAPLLVTWLLGYRKLTLFAGAFTGIVAIHYSTSHLSMNYAFRFGYHLIAPLLLFLIFILSEENVRNYLHSQLFSRFKNKKIVMAAIPFLAIGLAATTLNLNLIELADRYPKLLVTHGQVGTLIKSLNQKNKIRAIAVGDAGMIPYIADLPNLDLLKLGTHIGATKGISRELIEQYQVDFAVLRGFKYSEAETVEALKIRKLKPICVVQFNLTYKLHLWARESKPVIQQVCDSSKRLVSESELSFFLKNVQLAPWVYWR